MGNNYKGREGEENTHGSSIPSSVNFQTKNVEQGIDCGWTLMGRTNCMTAAESHSCWSSVIHLLTIRLASANKKTIQMNFVIKKCTSSCN